MKSYINTYLRTSERIFNELEEAGNTSNAEDMYVKAHTVKPQVQYMGITKLQEILLNIEQLSRLDPGSSELSGLVDLAISIYKKSAEELRSYLKSMSTSD